MADGVYRSKNEARRALLEGRKVVNGIDRVEVDPDQRTLRVHFFHPLPPAADAVPRGAAPLRVHNVQILGGVRVKDVHVTHVKAARDVLVVEVDQPGDFSPYLLRIVQSHAHPDPPKGFDPVLSQVGFSFKVDCPSDFDCAPAEAPRAPRGEEPVIDYLSRDYQGFRRLMLDRMSLLAPGWTERNAADLGVTVVEALAHVADGLSYAQDAAATEAYLGTARRRPSVRRHARLLDHRMHDGCNARAWIALEVGPTADNVLLPREARDPKTGRVLGRTRFLTPVAGPVMLDGEAYEEGLREGRPAVFEPMHDLVLFSAHNQILLHDWGDEAACLPEGATRATLVDGPPRLRLRPGDVLVFEEAKGPHSGLPEDADPTRRWAVRLTRVSPHAHVQEGTWSRLVPTEERRDELEGTGVVEVEWAHEDALPFAFCLSSRVDDRVVRDVTVARGNVVLADHGRTVDDPRESHGVLVPPRAPDSGPYAPRLRDPNVTQRVPLDGPAMRRASAAALLRQDPTHALPALELRSEDDQAWRPRHDLLASGRFAREVVVETEEDGTARVRFGDGFHGRRPVPGTAFEVRYRLGTGRAGNVGAESLRHVLPAVTGVDVLRVRNPMGAAGGADPEPIERVRLLAPARFRDQRRAVTADDYEEALERHPDVQKAIATRRWTGSWFTTFLAVDLKGGRTVDGKAEAALLAHLDDLRLAGHALEIQPPRHVPLHVVMRVRVRRGHYASGVKKALLEALGTGVLADGRLGFFHPDRFTFGQAVHLSELVAAAMAVPGVEWVDLEDGPGSRGRTRFRRLGQASHDEWAQGRIPMGRLEVARLDNDPNAPENGRLELLMEGGH